jgi:hypothetical protein
MVEMNKRDEKRLIQLFQKHPTPTDIIAKAFKARKCDLIFYFKPPHKVTVKGSEIG